MNDTVVIGCWVSLHEGCEITSEFGGSDAALLTVRGKGQPLELHFQAEPLRQFIEQGAQALAEMDALAVQEGVAQAARERAAADRPAGVQP